MTWTDVAAAGTQWALFLGAVLGAALGVLVGRWSVFLQLHWSRVAWHEVRRWRRLRRLRRCDWRGVRR